MPRAPDTAPSPAPRECVERGRRLRRAGRLDDAEAAFREALAADPDDLAAQNDLGTLLLEQGKLGESVSTLRTAAARRPDVAALRFNLGNTYMRARRVEEAAAEYRRAIALEPEFAAAHCNLGAALRDAGRPDEAADVLRRAVAIDPDGVDGHVNLGAALQALGRFDAAAAAYRRALERAPDQPQARLNLGIIALLEGDLAAGFAGYEWRWKVPGWPTKRRDFGRPQWAGEVLDGRTVLLHPEQGIGDIIQFVRYAPMVGARGGRVVVECPASLMRLLKTAPGIDRLVPKGTPLPAFDLHCPLISLAHALGTTRDRVPAPVPYLAAEPERVARWRRRLAAIGDLRVGIAWQGSREHPADRDRSIALARFAALDRVPGVSLVSLQKGDDRDQLARLPDGMTVEDLADELDIGDDAFVDTAAAMMHLDLVITADTAVAHLAGALGRPVWVALKHVPDWRWMLDRGDTPWYPTMRLFRQRRRGEWRPVFDAMAQELKNMTR